MVNNRIEILQEEIALAKEKMKYNIAMKPIVLYMKKRVEELLVQGETNDK